MPLKISLKTKPSSGIPLIFFLLEGDDVFANPLLKFLGKEEIAYLAKIKASLKIKEKEVKVLITSGRTIMLVGLCKARDFGSSKVITAMRLAVQAARRERLSRFACWVGPMENPAATRAMYELMAANFVMANFEFVKYKTPPLDGFAFLKEIEAIAPKLDRDIQEGFRRGIIIGEETNACRELSNMPGGDMTPAVLAKHAVDVARRTGITATILDEKKMKALKMGGVLGVAQGSDAPAKFIILEYRKGSKNEKPTVLAGKGVTFDTGGLNLKPGDSIYEMHMDMSGGAAVIHAIAAAARLKLKKNIVALVPAVENMPSGSSYRPGDLLRTMSGKTIEVLNTDAEGRVILADALEYAKRYDPKIVIDVATLTGAAIAALGLRYTALFATDQTMEDHLRALGEATGDLVWPLPLTADYEDDIRGTFGDWANTSTRRGLGGGAITGAVFLWQFTKDKKGEQAYPWVHLDIAPRMTAIEGDHLAKGALGTPVRLLVRLLEE
jgi:leucyl aminopeptidase